MAHETQTGALIKRLRKQNRLSADHLAELIGKTTANRKQYIYDIESGKIKKIDILTLKRLSKALSVTFTELTLFSPKELDVVLPPALGPTFEENNWKEKYYLQLHEISNLKDKIIELMSKVNAGLS